MCWITIEDVNKSLYINHQVLVHVYYMEGATLRSLYGCGPNIALYGKGPTIVPATAWIIDRVSIPCVTPFVILLPPPTFILVHELMILHPEYATSPCCPILDNDVPRMSPPQITCADAVRCLVRCGSCCNAMSMDLGMECSCRLARNLYLLRNMPGYNCNNVAIVRFVDYSLHLIT